jgi:formylglycine-generating enzyme required for sulfatase activity
VIRGGSWISNASVCRSAYRIHGTPDGFDYNIGFRPVLTTGQ